MNLPIRSQTVPLSPMQMDIVEEAYPQLQKAQHPMQSALDVNMKAPSTVGELKRPTQRETNRPLADFVSLFFSFTHAFIFNLHHVLRASGTENKGQTSVENLLQIIAVFGCHLQEGPTNSYQAAVHSSKRSHLRDDIGNVCHHLMASDASHH